MLEFFGFVISTFFTLVIVLGMLTGIVLISDFIRDKSIRSVDVDRKRFTISKK